MKRELKVKELHLIDAARRRFLKHQQDQRMAELHRLDDEIQRKVCQSATSVRVRRVALPRNHVSSL